jgi:Zn-dependent protease with chaperone function
VWAVCAWLLARTSVPTLHLGGLDESRYFTAHELARARSFSRGLDWMWIGGVVTELGALAVLVKVLGPRARTIGLGRIGTAVIVGMVTLTTLWTASLSFSVLELWWQHHWGLGPFDVAAWLGQQWGSLVGEAWFGMALIVLVVGFAGRFGRLWPVAVWPVLVAVTALFAFTSGYLESAGTTSVRDPQLRADIVRLERAEHVQGTPVRVDDVSSVTNQVNAFTVGFGPSAHVVLWNTVLRLPRAQVDVVLAHELGHVRSRHIIKAIGWSALLTLPCLVLLELATRRRGGLRDPANLPLALLSLVVVTLLAAPLENYVSRRYEAEADWRALNATRTPVAAQEVFEGFGRDSLEDPDPGLLDYLWLENHPTPMQRIAMTKAWTARQASR